MALAQSFVLKCVPWLEAVLHGDTILDKMISESMNDGTAETLQAGEANMNLEYATSQ